MTRARVLSTLTAASAGLGVTLAATSAKAFVPAVLAAIIGGSVLGGAVLGTAANNAATYPYYATAAPVAVTPGVSVNATTCYYTRRINPATGMRERVCRTPVP